MKRHRILLFIAGLLLLLANIYILINRNAGFKYYPLKTYNEIYQTDSSFYIKDIFFTTDSVKFTFSQKLVCPVYDEGNNKINVHENSITFHLRPDFEEYVLKPQSPGAPALIFHIDHSLSEPGKYINEFLYSNVPGPGIIPSPIKRWENGSRNYTAKEIAQGLEMLEGEAKKSPATDDEQKLLQIAHFLSTISSNASGVKSNKVNTYSPLRQIELSMQGKAQLDCGNYTNMLAFFCDIENIPNRRITYRGPDGNWRYGVHYMNEIYLREKQTWVLADALNNIYLPHDSLKYFNAADLKKIFEVNGLGGKNVFTFCQDSLQEVPYDSVAYWHRYYNQTNASIAYLDPGKEHTGLYYDLLHFYTFNQNEIWYNDNKQNDWPLIFLKLFSFYGFILCLILFFLMKKKGGKISHKKV